MILINTNPFWVFTLMSPYRRSMFLTCLEIFLYGHFSLACQSVLVAKAPVAVYGIWSQSKTTHNHIDHLNSQLSTTPSDPDARLIFIDLLWHTYVPNATSHYPGNSFLVGFVFWDRLSRATCRNWVMELLFCCKAKHTFSPLWKRSVLQILSIFFKSVFSDDFKESHFSWLFINIVKYLSKIALDCNISCTLKYVKSVLIIFSCALQNTYFDVWLASTCQIFDCNFNWGALFHIQFKVNLF